MDRTFTVAGDIYYTPSPDLALSIPDGRLVVVDGKVEGVYRALPERYAQLPLLDFTGSLVIPGLTDLHMHASQYQFRGLWMDEELLDWLNGHTFPEEAKYSDLDYARKAYSIFTEDLLRSATTRANIFATIHLDSSLLLASMLDEAGLCVNVGKVNMDRNSPENLCENAEESLERTRSFIESVLSECTHVKPIVTPRFIPSCTDDLSRGLGMLAREYGIPVQSHLSENLSEIDWVRELCPRSTSYADAYRQLGLWGEVKTVMAHCVHSLTREDELFDNPNIFIAHCPDSNVNLSSGIFPASIFLSRGCNAGLGSDVAGGTGLSILKAVTDSIKMSKLYWRLVECSAKPLDFTQAFYMASRGGGSFFGKVGSFEPGFDADIVVLDESGIRTALEDLSVAERLERYCYLKGESGVKAKAVEGRWLFGIDQKRTTLA